MLFALIGLFLPKIAHVVAPFVCDSWPTCQVWRNPGFTCWATPTLSCLYLRLAKYVLMTSYSLLIFSNIQHVAERLSSYCSWVLFKCALYQHP